MLEIEIPSTEELYDEKTNTFFKIKGCKLLLEHSLISLRKWEAKWHIPFLSEKEEKTPEMMRDYIRCMTISPSNPDPNVYNIISMEQLNEISEYIKNPMTATWFSKPTNATNTYGIKRREVVTAEIIYYWMIMLNIPSEYEKWHLNQLMTLIRVINNKNGGGKPMKKADQLRENARLNDLRRAKLHTRG